MGLMEENLRRPPKEGWQRYEREQWIRHYHQKYAVKKIAQTERALSRGEYLIHEANNDLRR